MISCTGPPKPVSKGLVVVDLLLVTDECSSSGSGILPSEPHSACTCEVQNQPDSVKVIIASNGEVRRAPAPNDQKKLRELRTLKQHYYPEGGWGWVVVLVACLVHSLVLGTQTVLASIVISFGKPNSVSRKLQPELLSSASK